MGFPFLTGQPLHDILEQAVGDKDEQKIESILREYVHRIMNSGGETPFRMTTAFAEVFGEVELAGDFSCAKASDIDMIFSNILVNNEYRSEADAEWKVIDYEWTFDFPIPKVFLIYRAFYFAYHQIFYSTDWNLNRLLELAGITPEVAKKFQCME